MANRYANLVGSNKIKDEYTKINTGFDAVQTDIDNLSDDLSAHKADAVAHVTQAEHDKLAGIELGAQVNQNAFSRVNDVQATTEEDALTIEGGTGIAITTDPAQKRVVITATGQATPGPHASSHITGGTDVIPDAVPNGSSGLMSGADKAKLDALPNDVQTQLDDIRADIGDMSTVPTTSKVVAGAISELFQSVSDGKSAIAAAITDKGVPTSPTDTFATMAANIWQIETGGPWFGDWGAYQTVYSWNTSVNVPANTWHTFVDVNGQGLFKWCRATTSLTNPRIRLTIDGQQYLFEVLGSLQVGNMVNVDIPFESNLKIEVLNSDPTSPVGIQCDYLYFLQSQEPNHNINTILNQSSRMQRISTTTSSSLVDVVNITGSGYLLALRFGLYLMGSVSGGVVYGDLMVDGSQKITNRSVYALGSTGAKGTDFFGPIRFENSLRVRCRTDGTANLVALCIVEYSLD